jgi:hypothetical protein
MMKDAVRVENALPPDDNSPAVPAFECEAAAAGTVTFSRPCPERPTLRMSVVAGAPDIVKVPSRLPSLSVTETVTGRPIEAAVETACEITCCTSDAVKLCGKTGETVNRSITKGTDHALVVRRRSFFMMSKEYYINRGISQAFGPSGWSPTVRRR